MSAGALLGTGALLAATGAWAHGAFHRNSPLFGRVLTRLPDAADGSRSVSLTFDDGPSPDATPMVLDALRDAGVKGTFFILGRHAERWPALVERVAREGHQLGNHGYWHRKLHFRSPAYVRDDLERGTAVIERACGERPRVFRAPHGFRSPWVTAAARALGQRVVGWSLGVWDSDRPGVDVIVQRVLDGVRPGSIVLLHDADGYDPEGDRTQTALALPAILRGLAERGYRVATLPA
jgi:peptidoglycan/xylan/chitin deacetylase (PgdA/CDA1 family)